MAVISYRRNRRHSDRKYLGNYTPQIDFDGIRKYWQSDGWTEVRCHETKWYIYKDGKELYVPGVDCYLYYEWMEDDGDIYTDSDVCFMALDELVELGFAE